MRESFDPFHVIETSISDTPDIESIGRSETRADVAPTGNKPAY